MSREVGFDEGLLRDAVADLIARTTLSSHVTASKHESLVGNGKTVYVYRLPTGVYAMLSSGERRLWDLVASAGSGLPVRLKDLFDEVDAEGRRLVAQVVLAGLRVSTREIEGAN